MHSMKFERLFTFKFSFETLVDAELILKSLTVQSKYFIEKFAYVVGKKHLTFV